MTESPTLDATSPARALEQVEGDVWGDPPPDASYLVRRAYELRRVPLDQLGTEDLRLLIGQEIGVPTLLPLALRVLGGEPLAEGDFYPGDLLAAVLRLGPDYWATHPDQRSELAGIVATVDAAAENFPVGTDLPELLAAFRGGRP